MSSLHFVVHDIYKKRVVQLGENPKYIFNVGSLAADSIFNTKLIKKNVLEKKFNLKFSKNNFLVTFHPETLARKKSKIQIKILLSALRTFKNTMFIFTYPGADLENKEIINEIKIFTKRHNNAYFFRSLGQKNYLSFMNCVDGIIGNSSSGILEMPYFKKGTVNIGKRQTGRLCANSVINTKIHKRSIEKSIKKIISKNFLKKIKQSKNNLFGSSGVSDKIIKILKKINYKHINKKSFFDIKIYKKK
jgi:GDP/UDP-N,N'-diacetylbacillosamine 2-epimerase (hydrolysing)